jgi:hypothetical protein
VKFDGDTNRYSLCDSRTNASLCSVERMPPIKTRHTKKRQISSAVDAAPTGSSALEAAPPAKKTKR